MVCGLGEIDPVSMNQLALKNLLACLLVLLSLEHAMAACGLDRQQDSLDLAYAERGAFIASTSNPYTIEAVSTGIYWQSANWQASHEYLALEYDQDNDFTPATSGDLHTVVTGITGKRTSASGESLSMALLPTLAFSSNMGKNPDKFKLDAFRLDGHLVASYPAGSLEYLIGVCASTLTGEYEVRPVAGVQYRSDAWSALFAYPASRFETLLDKNTSLFVEWRLAGRQWHVLDEALRIYSDFNYEAQLLSMGLGFRLGGEGRLQVRVVHWQQQAMHYLARNASRQLVELGDVTGWMLHYSHKL